MLTKKLFLIMGCQRSGSTLLESIFNKLEVRKQLDDPMDTWLVVYGHNEIRKCIANLAEPERLEEKLRSLYEQTNDLNDPRFGGFCWMVKNRFIPHYSRSILPTKIVRYEVLIANPEPYLRQVCQFLDLEWSDRLLEHEKCSSGQWGGTKVKQFISARSMFTKNI